MHDERLTYAQEAAVHDILTWCEVWGIWPDHLPPHTVRLLASRDRAEVERDTAYFERVG